MNKETISCMILKSKTHKIMLDIKNDFEANHAEMLLKYQTYLLYDVEIFLQSADAFDAINYFLDKVTGKMSHKFFRQVDAHFSKDWIGPYNKFMKHYLDKGLKIEKLDTEIKDEGNEEEQANEIPSMMPPLEFFDIETIPKSEKYPFKIVRVLDIVTNEINIDNFSNIDWLFDTILIKPQTLKMLYENQYELAKKHVVFTKSI